MHRYINYFENKYSTLKWTEKLRMLDVIIIPSYLSDDFNHFWLFFLSITCVIHSLGSHKTESVG